MIRGTRIIMGWANGRVKRGLELGGADDFFDGRDACAHLIEAIFAQENEALLAGGVEELAGRRTLQDQFAQVVVEVEKLEDALSAGEAGVAAVATALAAVELFALPVEIGRDLGRLRRVLLAALLADAADETLGEDGFERTGDEEGL